MEISYFNTKVFLYFNIRFITANIWLISGSIARVAMYNGMLLAGHSYYDLLNFYIFI